MPSRRFNKITGADKFISEIFVEKLLCYRNHANEDIVLSTKNTVLTLRSPIS